MNVFKNFYIILSIIAAGCADVQPWERGNLAKPSMALDPYPEQTELRAHSYGAREASQPRGGGGSGGGCGCY